MSKINTKTKSTEIESAFDDTAVERHKDITGTDVGSKRGLDVVQYSRQDSVFFKFTSPSLTSSQDFILVDFSDTINYKHEGEDYLELDFLRIHVDSDNTGEYRLEIGFLENVDDANGDFYPIYELDHVKSSGRVIDEFLDYYPNGPKLKSDFVVTNPTLNDAAFQTDVNLASTLDSSTADTPSGGGDLVLRVIVTSGSCLVNLSGKYHAD